ncbi:MAG: hypothetical protein R3181_15675, partial [Rubricoccaceae bacterium]|nr:hypothetical protein [Rubricoccaceae bacterium]
SPPVPYVPDVEAWAAVYSEGFVGHLARVQAHAGEGAPVSDAQARYPVLLFSSGFGMSRHFYTGLLEGLASHGYVVAALDRPYLNMMQMPDGSVRSPRDGFWDAFPATRGIGSLEAAVRQLRFTEGYLGADQDAVLAELSRIDRGDPHGVLTGRLDLGRVVNLAHSAGAIPARALLVDPEAPYRGFVFYDAKVHHTTGSRTLTLPVEGEVRAPVLFVALEYAAPPPPSFADQLRAPLYIVQMEGTAHGSVSDLPALDAAAEGDAEASERAAAHLQTLVSRTVDFVRASLDPEHTLGDAWQTAEEGVAEVQVLVPAQR